MQNLRLLACVVAALGSIAIAGCGSSSNDCDDSTSNNNGNCVCDTNGNCVPAPTPAPGALNVHNQSSVAITEIHVAAVGNTNFGANLISNTVLAPGASLSVTVACGQYDALLIDQAGQQCTLHNVSLCFSSADWIITNNTCAAFTTTPTTTTGSAPASDAAP